MSTLQRKLDVEMTSHLYKKIQPQKRRGIIQCYYCGLPADGEDHVLPVSYLHTLLLLGKRQTSQIVPCCGECNSLAGEEVFRTAKEKRRYIHDKLKKRYSEYLGMPEWTSHELAEVGPNLRQSILSGLELKLKTERRLRFKYRQADTSSDEKPKPQPAWQQADLSPDLMCPIKLPDYFGLQPSSSWVLWAALEEDGEAEAIGFCDTLKEAERTVKNDGYIAPYFVVWWQPIEETGFGKLVEAMRKEELSIIIPDFPPPIEVLATALKRLSLGEVARRLDVSKNAIYSFAKEAGFTTSELCSGKVDPKPTIEMLKKWGLYRRNVDWSGLLSHPPETQIDGRVF